MPPIFNSNGHEQKSSTSCSSLMCCTSERQGQYTTTQRSTTAYREQSRFLWLDPTRWVEKRSFKKEKVGFGLQPAASHQLHLRHRGVLTLGDTHTC